MSQSYGVKMCDISMVRCIYVVCLLFLFALTKDGVAAKSSPSTEFSRHRIVQPIVHHGRTKREISTTRDTSGAHHSDVSIRVQIKEGVEYILDLRLNEDLIPDDHVVRYQKNGKTIVHKPKKKDINLCQYTGTVRGKPHSRVAVSTCRGLRGVISDGDNIYYIQPEEGNDIQSPHYLFDHSDLKTIHRCGYEGGVTKNKTYDPLLLKKYTEEKNAERSRGSRYKREAEDTQVRGPFNANKLSRYVELVLVSDHREFQANGESVETVHHQLKDVANIINSVYSPLNIFIALVGVVIWTERDEIQLVENGDDTLNNFLRYRRFTLLSDIPNDNAHLITRQKFREGVVGKALKGPICTYEFSGGVATNHSEVIGLVATTIAHEMGHNFGMEHDTEQDCECPDDKCIMSPSSTSVMPIHWSSCSLKSLALAFERGMDYCLRNKPKRLFDSPTCGNGFVEPGEQCDCGLRAPAACRACCDDSCMLRSNATCATGACCDLETCRPKSAGTVCRAAERECDLAEYCTGHSEFCPADVFKMDSTPCGNEQAYCVRGSCRSHTDQCRLLWGTTGENSHEKCYTRNNVNGTKNGNCGYLRTRQVFRACAEQDALCGMLHCRHLNERLEFGMESVAQLHAVFINNNGKIIPCRTAIIDLGLSDVDPGMVPDGAKCGDDKMCLNQKCVSVQSVRDSLAAREGTVCPSNCSGHGVCNSEGHCHCEPGFAPPLCMLPGPGGSYDSGPATDPSLQRNFMVAMYIIFLGIIPLILLVLFLLYYSRRNVLFWQQKPRKSYVFYETTRNLFNKHLSMPKFGHSTSLRNLIGNKNSSDNESSPDTKNNKETEIKAPCTNTKNIKDTIVKVPRTDIKITTKDKTILPCPDTKHITIKPKVVEQCSIPLIDSKSDANEKTKPVYHKILHLKHKSQNKKTLKKLDRKINKDDIKIASEVDIREVVKPPVKPKPKPSESKPNVTIVKAGLTSTTNEMIANIKNRSRLHSIKNEK